ncbi:hypothetical protein, partial [Salmonella sp. SAL4457]|uniref:hypothetical protein n=1 Tax=Salmonella sp. SAL4457 TaxID=3159912 RepID=UPI003979D1FC
PIQDYVNVDVHLDPDWEQLPEVCIKELHTGRVTRQNPQGLNPVERNQQRGLQGVVEPWTIEADQMARATAKPATSSPTVSNTLAQDDASM